MYRKKRKVKNNLDIKSFILKLKIKKLVSIENGL